LGIVETSTRKNLSEAGHARNVEHAENKKVEHAENKAERASKTRQNEYHIILIQSLKTY